MKGIKKIQNPKLRMFVFVVLMIITASWFCLRIAGNSKNALSLQKNSQNPLVSGAEEVCASPDKAVVKKIIDGDTVEIAGGFRVRLLEIDTPEYGENCYNEARARLEELVLGKEIVLQKDQTDIDKYGRCLRYVLLAGKNINLQMVEEGFAKHYIFEADTKYKEQILQAEELAKSGKQGCLWE
jgi:micrococcal nuclease